MVRGRSEEGSSTLRRLRLDGFLYDRLGGLNGLDRLLHDRGRVLGSLLSFFLSFLLRLFLCLLSFFFGFLGGFLGFFLSFLLCLELFLGLCGWLFLAEDEVIDFRTLLDGNIALCHDGEREGEEGG